MAIERNQRPGVLDRPEIEPGFPRASGTHGWVVVVFDNPVNTFDEVIHILQVATGCSLEEAKLETWEIHNYGKSVVHNGDRPECEQAAAVIAQIGIDVSVSQE